MAAFGLGCLLWSDLSRKPVARFARDRARGRADDQARFAQVGKPVTGGAFRPAERRFDLARADLAPLFDETKDLLALRLGDIGGEFRRGGSGDLLGRRVRLALRFLLRPLS